MNTNDKPSIGERLEYIKVCDAAVEAYDRLSQVAEHNSAISDKRELYPESSAFLRQCKEYLKLKDHYSKLKVAIALDLCQDPKFVKYSETMRTPLQLEDLANNDIALQTVAQHPSKKSEVDIEGLGFTPRESTPFERAYDDVFGVDPRSM